MCSTEMFGRFILQKMYFKASDISDAPSDLFLCYMIKGRQNELMLPFVIEESFGE